MSALEQEIVSLVQDKYLFRSVSATVNKWNAEFLSKVYQRLLSVYDSSFDYSSSSRCVEAKLQHVQKCFRLLGIGHLAPKLEELTDSSRALRIISAIDDKISAKHTVQAAAKRTRIILKKEEMQNKPAKKLQKAPVKKNLEQENVDPNIHSPKPVSFVSSSGSVMTQNAWLQQQNDPSDKPQKDDGETIIPTGRQLPRTPVRPTDLPPEESDSFETSKEEECKNNELSNSLGNTETDPKLNFIPSGKQLPRTPKADGNLNSSDQEPACGISDNLVDEHPYTEKCSAPNTKDTGIKVQMKGGMNDKSVKDIKADANRRGTYVLPEPPISRSENNVERLETITLPPPVGYEEKDSPRDFMQEQIDRRGTFNLPPPIEFKEEKSNIESEGVDRRGTFTVPPPQGYSKDSPYSITRDFDSERRDTFILPPPRGYDKESCSLIESSDRRGTFSIDAGKETLCDSSLDEDNSVDDDSLLYDTNRRGTYVLPAPSEQGNRRGTYAVTGPSDTFDRRGTYDLGKTSCLTQDYIGAVCQNKMKNQVLVFDHPSPDVNKPMGPVPDMSEFDDLPFTDEPSVSEDDVSNGTFSVSAEVSSERHSGNSSSQCHNQTNAIYEMPLPASITKNHPSTPRENYIPRGRQIPRTPNDPSEDESKEMSTLTSISGTTFEQSNNEDPNFSIQIFLKEKVPVAPEHSRNMESEKENVVLADNPKRNVCANSIQVKRPTQITSDELNITTEVEKEVEENIDKHFDGNATYEQEKSGHNDLQNSLLEEKLQESWRSEQGSYLEFDDSCEIFPSRVAKKGLSSNHRESYGTESSPSKEKATKKIANESTTNHKKQLIREQESELDEYSDNSTTRSRMTIEKCPRENEMTNKCKKNSTQVKTKLEKTNEKHKEKDMEKDKGRVEVRNMLEMEVSPNDLKKSSSSEQASYLKLDDSQEMLQSRMAKKGQSSNNKEKLTRENEVRNKNQKISAKETGLCSASVLNKYNEETTQDKSEPEKRSRKHKEKDKGRNTDKVVDRNTLETLKIPVNLKEEDNEGDLLLQLGTDLDDSDQIFLHSVKTKKSKPKLLSKEYKTQHACEPYTQEYAEIPTEKTETLDKPKNVRKRVNNLDDKPVVPRKGRRKEELPEENEKDNIKNEEPFTKEQDELLKHYNSPQILPKRGRRKKNEEAVVEINKNAATVHKDSPTKELYDVATPPKRGRRKKKESELLKEEEEVKSQTHTPTEETSKVSVPPRRGRRKKNELEMVEEYKDVEEKLNKNSSSDESSVITPTTKPGRRNTKAVPATQKVNNQKNSAKEITEVSSSPKHVGNQKNDTESDKPKQGRRNKKTVKEENGNLKLLGSNEYPKLDIIKEQINDKTDSEQLPVREEESVSLLESISSKESARPVAVSKQGKRKAKATQESLQQVVEDDKNLPPSEELEKRDSPQTGKPPKKATKDIPSTIGDNLEETMKVPRRGRKKKEIVEDSNNTMMENISSEVVEQPESKVKARKQTNRKEAATASASTKTKTRQKKTPIDNIEQVDEMDNTTAGEKITSDLELESKKPKGSKKLKSEQVDNNIEQVDEVNITNAVEKITSEISKKTKGNKKINSELVADEGSDTKKQRGRKKKVILDRSLEPDLDIQEITKKREVKASQRKKEVVQVLAQEVPAATGRASRRCKTIASAAIAEALNSSDTEFLKTIRAYN